MGTETLIEGAIMKETENDVEVAQIKREFQSNLKSHDFKWWAVNWIIASFLILDSHPWNPIAYEQSYVSLMYTPKILLFLAGYLKELRENFNIITLLTNLHVVWML